MDTISRENNSMLPVGGIIVGAIGLLLGGLALVQISKVNKALSDQQAKFERIDSVEGQISSATTAADRAKNDVAALQRSTQTAFDTVGPELARLAGEITKLQESSKRPTSAAKTGGAPVVAGPGEYVVASGDTGMKIARAQGISLGDLQAVNPGVEWRNLKVGQKLKLPKK
jgi:LysM repeat protein